MLSQTAHFTGLGPERLYRAFLSAKDHAAMTADGRYLATFRRRVIGDVLSGEEGDELLAFGVRGTRGDVVYRLTAKILHLVPEQMIVMAWKNAAWAATVDSNDATEMDSIVVLTFARNVSGAEIRLTQTNLPDYKVHLPDTGETGPLSQIVNTHWSLLYWEPMRNYFAQPGAASP